MKSYEKPELKVISFKAQEDFAALSEYYYTAEDSTSGTSYRVSLFVNSTGGSTETESA